MCPAKNPQKNRILLILDLDETLVYATETALAHEPDLAIGPYSIYQRPQLEPFLRSCAAKFDIAVWSSGNSEYVQSIVCAVFPSDVQPVFVWTRDCCTERRDLDTDETYFIKDLKKVARRGYSLSRVLILEDSHRNVKRHYGNAIYVPAFHGDPDDTELDGVLKILDQVENCQDVRLIEKRRLKPSRSSSELPEQ